MLLSLEAGTYRFCGDLQLMATTSLIRFLLVNGIGGFLIGIGAGVGFLMLYADTGMFIGQPLAVGMLLWAFGVSFAMGVIATGLALHRYY